MKTNLIRIYVVIFLVCGNAKAMDMPPLAKSNNCVACHSIDKKIVGPAWMDVSKRYREARTYSYKGKEYPLAVGLIKKVSKGGAGNWGAVPMPGNSPAVKDADIKELVGFVLNLSK